MTNFIIYAITLFGFCYCVGLSRISMPVRDYLNRWKIYEWPLEMIECPACFSTWIGLAIALFWPSLAHSVAGDTLSKWYVFPFLSCGSSAVIGLLTGVMR